MNKLLSRLFLEDDGPTAVEYAVLLAMIVIVCVGAVHTLATSTAASYSNSATELDGVLGAGS